MEKNIKSREFLERIRILLLKEAIKDYEQYIYMYVFAYIGKLMKLNEEKNYFEKKYYSLNDLINELLEDYKKIQINNDKDVLEEILREQGSRFNYSCKEIFMDKLIRILYSVDIEVFDYILRMNIFDISKDVSVQLGSNIEIINLVEKIMDINEYDSILDMCSGVGDFLSNIFIDEKNNKLTGIEINREAILISKIRTVGLRRYVDYFNSDVLKFYQEEKFNKIFASFPLGVKIDKSYLNELEHRSMLFNWDKYPANTPDWVFINTMLSMLSKDGIAITITSNASLYKDIDARFRKDIVDNGYLNSIIQLPKGFIKGTAIDLNLLIFNKNSNGYVKMIDASNFGEKIKGNLYNKRLTLEDVDKIYKLYLEELHELVKCVPYEEIRNKDYNLVVGEYIGKKEIEYINPHKISEYAEDVFRGYQPMTNKDINNKKEYELLTISDINDGIISDDLKFIDGESKKLDRYILKENDVIVTCKGTVLKFAVVTNVKNRKIIPSGNFIVIRLKPGKLNPYYLISYLNSKDGIDGLYQLQTGSNIFSINPQKIASMVISVLDMEKQESVAKKYRVNQTQIALTKKRLVELKENMEQLYYSEVEG